MLQRGKLGIVFITLALLLVGCAGKSEKLTVYDKNILVDNVSDQEMKKLFNNFLKDNNILDTCIQESYKNQGFVDYVESNNNVCYRLEGSSIKLDNYSRATAKWQTVDKSWHVGRTNPEYSDAFKKKLKDRESVLDKFQGKVETFSKFKIAVMPSIKKKEDIVNSINKKEENNLDSFLKSLKVSIQDKRNILPPIIKQQYVEKIQIRKVVNRPASVDAVDYYLDSKKQAYLDEIIENPLVAAKNYRFSANVPSGNVGRFLITFAKSHYDISYVNSTNPIVFEVKSVKHNFVPSSFKASDKSIETKMIDTEIVVMNNTKSFLDVSKISIYYDGEIFTKDINLELPPESKVPYNVSSFSPFKNAMLNVSQRNKQVKFGYAINYINKNISKRQTLYKTDDQSIDGFLK